MGNKFIPLVAGPGVQIETVPIDFPPWIPEYIWLSALGVAGLETRVAALETAGNNIPGKLKGDGSNVLDPNFMLHIGVDRVVTSRITAGSGHTKGIFVRGPGYQLFRANCVTPRDSSWSMHVTPDRTWVNRLTADELAAPHSRLCRTASTPWRPIRQSQANLQISIRSCDTSSLLARK